MGDLRILMRARRAIGALNLPDNDFVYGLRHSLHRARVKIFQTTVALGLTAVRINYLTLHVHRKTGEGVGRILAQALTLGAVPVGFPDVRSQALSDNIQPRQFALADFTSLRHMVPHPAGELIAFLLQLVQ